MGKIVDPKKYGQAAGKNGQELGIENELKMLECIKEQGWVREHELHLITGMSQYTVGQVSRRLASKGQIYRERRLGNAGYFLRLLSDGAERVDGKSGKDVKIPKSWRHDALAIQSLHHLSQVFDCSFETEAQLRHRHKSGKLSDGSLVSDMGECYFEQELSRKSGEILHKQSRNIVRVAAGGTTCYIAYPYPPGICGGIDHEIRQTSSLRKHLGDADAKNIKLVRCHFYSRLEFENMHASSFEIIDLHCKNESDASENNSHGFVDSGSELEWQMFEFVEGNNQHCIRAVLLLDGGICHECTFFEAMSNDETHWLQSDHLGWDQESDDEKQPFDDFVREQKKRIEKQVMDAMERDKTS